MPASPDVSKRPPRPAPGRSPAIHIVRPLLLVAVVVAGVGWFRDSTALLVVAGVVTLLSGMLGSIVHQSHRRRVEQQSDIRCG